MDDDALKALIETTAAETRRHFDVVAEGLRHDVRLIAEKVMLVEDKLDREAVDFREGMSRGFAETQGMIQFSHVSLDQRVGALEADRDKTGDKPSKH